MSDKQLDKLFDALRKQQAELPVDQVEQAFFQHIAPGPAPKPKPKSKINPQKFTTMMSISGVLTISLYLGLSLLNKPTAEPPTQSATIEQTIAQDSQLASTLTLPQETVPQITPQAPEPPTAPVVIEKIAHISPPELLPTLPNYIQAPTVQQPVQQEPEEHACAQCPGKSYKVSNITFKDIPIGAFNRLRVKGVFDIHITQGEQESLRIEGDAEWIDKVDVTEKAGQLSIGYKGKVVHVDLGGKNKPWKERNDKIVIHLTYKKIDGLELHGSCNLYTTNTLKSDNLSIETSGMTDFKIDASIKAHLEIDASGMSNGIITTTCKSAKLDLSGMSDIVMKNFSAEELILDGSGMSTTFIHGHVKQATISLSGEGSVESPTFKVEQLSVDVSGMASCELQAKEVLHQDRSGMADIIIKPYQ